MKKNGRIFCLHDKKALFEDKDALSYLEAYSLSFVFCDKEENIENEFQGDFKLIVAREDFPGLAGFLSNFQAKEEKILEEDENAQRCMLVVTPSAFKVEVTKKKVLGEDILVDKYLDYPLKSEHFLQVVCTLWGITKEELAESSIHKTTTRTFEGSESGERVPLVVGGQDLSVKRDEDIVQMDDQEFQVDSSKKNLGEEELDLGIDLEEDKTSMQVQRKGELKAKVKESLNLEKELETEDENVNIDFTISSLEVKEGRKTLISRKAPLEGPELMAKINKLSQPVLELKEEKDKKHSKKPVKEATTQKDLSPEEGESEVSLVPPPLPSLKKREGTTISEIKEKLVVPEMEEEEGVGAIALLKKKGIIREKKERKKEPVIEEVESLEEKESSLFSTEEASISALSKDIQMMRKEAKQPSISQLDPEKASKHAATALQSRKLLKLTEENRKLREAAKLEKDMLEDKIHYLEKKLESARLVYTDLKHKINKDVLSIKEREQELEVRLELFKKDHGAKIFEREKQMLSMKKEIAALKLDLNHAMESAQYSKEYASRYAERSDRALKAMRLAISMLEEKDSPHLEIKSWGIEETQETKTETAVANRPEGRKKKIKKSEVKHDLNEQELMEAEAPTKLFPGGENPEGAVEKDDLGEDVAQSQGLNEEMGRKSYSHGEELEEEGTIVEAFSGIKEAEEDSDDLQLEEEDLHKKAGGE